MTEAELQARIIRNASNMSLLAHHCRDSRRCYGPSGFPDTVIAGPRGVMFAEVKSQTGLVTPEQEDWLAMLRRGGSLAVVVRPENYQDMVLDFMERLVG